MKTNFLVRWLLLCLVRAVVAGSTITVCAYPTYFSLSVPSEKQEMSNTCWAACGTAVVRYYNKTVTQRNFIISVFNSYVNYPVSMQTLQGGLSNFGIHSSVISAALSFTQIRSNTYNYERPMIAGLQWTNNTGHVVVIRGYSEDPNLGENIVEYMDPADGRTYSALYSTFVSSANHSWAESLNQIYPN